MGDRIEKYKQISEQIEKKLLEFEPGTPEFKACNEEYIKLQRLITETEEADQRLDEQRQELQMKIESDDEAYKESKKASKWKWINFGKEVGIALLKIVHDGAAFWACFRKEEVYEEIPKGKKLNFLPKNTL